MAALAEALAAVDSSEDARVVVISASGRLFCAGHDLAELRAAETSAERLALFEQCSALMMSLSEYRLPVIAQVQGAAVAAGCQLVASCDLAYAAQSAKFAVSGINLGLFCSTPGVALGRAVGRRAAAEMLMSGRFIDAAEAVSIGLINRAVPDAELVGCVDEMAATLAAKPVDAMTLGKRIWRQQMSAPLADAYAIASAAMAENLAFDSARAGIDGFLKR